MDLGVLHTLCEALAGDRLAWVYAGAFPDEHSAQLIALGEEVVAFHAEERAPRNKLAFVLVEVYQNIVRHRAPVDDALARGAGRSLFLLRDRANGQRVVAMDPLLRSEQPALEEQLSRIAGLSAAQLKELFLARLKSDHRSERGGAGLGLIEMARRTGQDLRHAFEPLDDRHVRFVLELHLGAQADPFDVGALAALHGLVEELDLLLLGRGRLTPAILTAMLQVMEREVQDAGGGSEALARVFLAATELVQAVPAGGQGPLVALLRAEEGHQFVLGLPIMGEEEKVLPAELAELATMPPGVVRQRYRDALLGRDGRAAPRLPLLDLARNASGPLGWAVHGGKGGRLLLVQVPVGPFRA